MQKTFDHAVIYGGVLYPANTPIEITELKKESTEEKEPEHEVTAEKEPEHEVTEEKKSEEEVNANDKRASRKSGTRSKDNK